MSEGVWARWERGEAALGAWCMLPSAHGAELIAAMGFDYVCVDCQHGLISADAMVTMLQAISGFPATPFVRVPSNEAGAIGKALDAGAHGIIVPLVNTPEEASGAVAACRFPPDGIRSHGLFRPRQTLTGAPDEINRRVLCFPMIETREGIERAEEICAVPGVDGIYVGPSDLAVSLGVPIAERGDSAEHRDAVERVRRACEGAGIVPGFHARNGEDGRAYVSQGFRLLTVAVDAALVGAGAVRELRAARGS
jgi:4-hydroxy-2-oxoheptanedioate aldolase